MNNLFKRAYSFVTGKYPVPSPIQLGHITVGRTYSRLIVAEIGINHNGSIEIAKKLIDAAYDAGARAVKFQKRTVPVVYTPEELAKPRVVDRSVLENALKRGVLSRDAVERLKKSDFKESTNGDLKWALEFTESEYKELFQYANDKGLIAFASPWDEGSVDVLERLNVPCYKVASASITDYALLRKIKKTGKPVLISTGMSTLEEIYKAVDTLGLNNLIIMHTVSTYPSENKDVNVKVVNTLRQLFPTTIIGYSGHERGIAPSLAAAVIGAHVIERHLTLDKKMFGTDQSSSLEPQELAELVKQIREFEEASGVGKKHVIDAEIPIREKLRRK